ncbi:MAG: hypothetical protein KKF44_09555 [Nanoarchaeota archaeon]|nr:hypothetical protein [Nanoarchaeota archaeon]
MTDNIYTNHENFLTALESHVPIGRLMTFSESYAKNKSYDAVLEALGVVDEDGNTHRFASMYAPAIDKVPPFELDQIYPEFKLHISSDGLVSLVLGTKNIVPDQEKEGYRKPYLNQKEYSSFTKRLARIEKKMRLDEGDGYIQTTENTISFIYIADRFTEEIRKPYEQWISDVTKTQESILEPMETSYKTVNMRDTEYIEIKVKGKEMKSRKLEFVFYYPTFDGNDVFPSEIKAKIKSMEDGGILKSKDSIEKFLD